MNERTMIADIRRRVDAMKADVAAAADPAEVGKYRDDEGLHIQQDEVYRDVLTAIARGHPTPKTLAEMALEIEHLDFSRWYA